MNCNVCTEDKACDALVPMAGTVCYKGGMLVERNFQNCTVTNKKILDMIPHHRIPEVTFSCQKENKQCDFQCKHVFNASLDWWKRILLLSLG